MKYVKSWWLQLLPNGIYHLWFNTTMRWMPYHRYNDTTYLFGDEVWGEEQIEIPEFLPKLEGVIWITTTSQNKDQISFYFIPYQKEWLQQEKLILKSNDTI